MKRWLGFIALAVLALLLAGCGSGTEEVSAATPTPAPTAAVTQRPQGAMDQAVQALLTPFDETIRRAAAGLDDAMPVTLPSDMLRQMADDAWQAGASAKDGKYAFTWRQTSENTYVAVNQDTVAENWSVTPDPKVEAPMGDAEMDEAEVSGGGLYQRIRYYDAAADLSSGQAEITDTLNGEPSGSELFSFAFRDGCLYYVDAVKDLGVDVDTLELQEFFSVTAGVVRRDGLDVIQYTAPDATGLPDPVTLDWNGLVSSVTPVCRITARGDDVRVSP